MTHILIPIKEIQARIAAKKAEIIHSEGLNDIIRVGIETSELQLLELLLSTSKQISLDEKDIEKKVNNLPVQELYDDVDKPTYRDGYKQALKDLL